MAKQTLLERLKKNTTIKEASLIKDSKIYGKSDVVSTNIPMLNVALSGELDGGLVSGLTQIAAPSKHFKSAFTLAIASAYQKKYDDSIVLFYDSEFGTPESYFETLDVDMSRVFHSPITDIQILNEDIMAQIDDVKRGDHLITIVDSLGNLASRKELDDVRAQKDVQDMSRAKKIKGLFRMVTPHLTIKDIPMIVINHTYKTQEMYSKDVVGGGTGSYYSSNTIWIIGRQQEKETSGTEKGKLNGFTFIINIEKSRFVKEKTKIPITVTFDGGIYRWSGLLDNALEGKFLVKTSDKTVQVCDPETGELSGDDLVIKKLEHDDAYFEALIKNEKFKEFIKNKYMIQSNLTGTPYILEDDEEEEDDE